MTISQYLPRWLRSRLQQPAPQKIRTLSKKDRQVLPTLPNVKRPAVRFQDDDSPPGYRIQWRL
jgi:hypothetical protein